MTDVLAVLHGIEKRFSDTQLLEAVAAHPDAVAYAVKFPTGDHMGRLHIYLVKACRTEPIQCFCDRIHMGFRFAQGLDHEF